jgi:hypothetical protein
VQSSTNEKEIKMNLLSRLAALCSAERNANAKRTERLLSSMLDARDCMFPSAADMMKIRKEIGIVTDYPDFRNPIN